MVAQARADCVGKGGVEGGGEGGVEGGGEGGVEGGGEDQPREAAGASSGRWSKNVPVDRLTSCPSASVTEASA